MLHIDDPGAIGGARSADMLERQVTNTNRFVYSTDVLPGVIRNYNVTVSLQINEPNATISDRLALTTIRGIQGGNDTLRFQWDSDFPGLSLDAGTQIIMEADLAGKNLADVFTVNGQPTGDKVLDATKINLQATSDDNPASLSLADILNLLGPTDVVDRTDVAENAAEVTPVPWPFRLVGGGALVLCERTQLLTAGRNGACKTATAANDPFTQGSISDILTFQVANDQLNRAKEVKLYSEPFPADLPLTLDGLKNRFGDPTADSAYVAYIEEGTFFDENEGDSIPITDADVTVYVRRGARGFDRAFIIRSDTTGTEVPEPSTWLLLATGCVVLLTVGRRVKSA